MDEQAKAVEEFIVSEIADGIEPGSLSHDEDLLAADLIDSLGIIALVEFVESRFGIAVEDEDLAPENFRSIDDIVSFVRRKAG